MLTKRLSKSSIENKNEIFVGIIVTLPACVSDILARSKEETPRQEASLRIVRNPAKIARRSLLLEVK